MASSEPWTLASVVAALRAADDGSVLPREGTVRPLPSSEAIDELTAALRAALFPGHFGAVESCGESLEFRVGAALDRVRHGLQEQVRRALHFAGGDRNEAEGAHAEATTDAFLARLPAIRRRLALDVRAAFEGDPAASGPDETLLCYPGVRAIIDHRLAHELHGQGVPLIPRIVSEHAHSVTGIDIHPGATIGDAFFIDHGTGVVVGQTCILGNRVRVYQGVTLGARTLPTGAAERTSRDAPRHPIVEDDVTIYAGATILGRVTIGRGSVIGGNVWLTRSVPPGSTITQARPREESFDGGGGI